MKTLVETNAPAYFKAVGKYKSYAAVKAWMTAAEDKNAADLSKRYAAVWKKTGDTTTGALKGAVTALSGLMTTYKAKATLLKGAIGAASTWSGL